MKRLLVLALIIIVMSGAAVFIVNQQSDKKAVAPVANNNDNKQKVTNQAFASVKACDLFTQADADKLFGELAKKGDTNSGDTSAADVNVTTCNYINSSTDLATRRSATVLVRSPKTQMGADSNSAQFNSQRPADTPKVSGYGDDAYWNPQNGQFNVLKKNTWLIISYGPLKAADRTEADAKKLADIIVPKL